MTGSEMRGAGLPTGISVPDRHLPALLPSAAVVRVGDRRSSASPASVYLSRLAPGSRGTMRGALVRIAAIAAQRSVDIESFRWEHLRYEDTQAIRAVLADR